ncbi:hypothetical protein Osc7112_1497 [Oscillatoria nigro-viridis PCC 7112]|uniref:Uncharacterized protein n=1 Tax=Phormidium nigroviride PCC 7112 TaxID=179408 RepID=K9VCY4_9CYAN|nr:hypothetical protein Osc7112_1497 [Oscillatoria nigro-viridis PCC 7112]
MIRTINVGVISPWLPISEVSTDRYPYCMNDLDTL